jgi:crotonobetainyl-CoA:carnitine CoA-transferase CaiB-like acyl-CoA transferase
VYPSAGDDAWVAVACADDEQWRSLCRVLGTEDRAGWSVDERRARRRDLDEVLSAWTSSRSRSEAQEVLQAAGVAAHQVQNSPEAFEDPQLAHRRHFREVPHDRQGTTWVEAVRFALSRTATVIERGAPTLGQDTFEVLTEVLGYDIDRVAELAGAELLE